jgi:hypothetical protein
LFQASGKERRLLFLVETATVHIARRQIAERTICASKHKHRLAVKSGAEFDLHLSVGFIGAGDEESIAQAPEPEGHRIDRLIAERRLEQPSPQGFFCFCNRVAAINAWRIDRGKPGFTLQWHEDATIQQRGAARPFSIIDWAITPCRQVGA